MNSKNSAFIVIIAIALLLGGLGGYLLSRPVASPTPTPEITGGTDADTIEGNLLPSPNDAKFLTYENKQYGLSFLYPATLARTSGGGALVSFTGSDSEIRILKIADSDANFKNIIIGNTYFDGSGANPKSFSEFSEKTIGENNFYYIRTGLFEGVLSLRYYAVRPDGIYVFSLISRGVDWTNPNFNVEEDQGHLYLKQILSSIVFGKSISPTPGPVKPVSLVTYRNDEAGYTVQYPKDFFVNESGKNPLNSNESFYGIFFNFPSSFTLGTNLSKESYISIETKAEVACTPSDFTYTGEGPISKSLSLQSDGISWTGKAGSDAAAGNYYTETIYTTMHNKTCYGAKLFLHATNVGNYEPGTIREFDQDAIDTIFKGMVSSIRFI